MKKVLVFPGQGSQKVGMCKDFYDNFVIAKDVFNEVDDTLNYKLSKLIFDGPKEELSLTSNTQAAIMASSIAILRVILNETGKNVNEIGDFLAGHSLGEYTALCAAGSLKLKDAAYLLKVRGSSMQSASPIGEGSMAACVGISPQKLNEYICNINAKYCLQIANDNVEGQIVVSGHAEAVDQIIHTLNNDKYRAIKLDVSAPFHSKLIEKAILPMSEALDKITMLAPSLPIICNINAEAETDPSILKQNLLKQIVGSVLWRQSMHTMNELNATHLIEIGNGTVLSNLAKKSPIDFQIQNISTIDDLKIFTKELM